MTWNTHHYLGLTLGSAMVLSDRTQSALVALVRQPPDLETEGALAGRRGVIRGFLDGMGAVVVKVYARGGLLGGLIGTRHLRWGEVRSAGEYRMLGEVRELGVRAPRPIAWLHDGRWWCQTWLVTEEIPEAKTLAEYAMRDHPRVSEWTREAMEMVKKLVANGVLHTDLHPGNVLVSGAGEVYLIDFDKTLRSRLSECRLRDRYLSRWRRAVIKHNLPDALAELASLELRQRVYG